MLRINVLIALALVAATVGCSPSYVWSSETGHACFSECTRLLYQCRAGCYGDVWCQLGVCKPDEIACKDGCPDLARR